MEVYFHILTISSKSCRGEVVYKWNWASWLKCNQNWCLWVWWPIWMVHLL